MRQSLPFLALSPLNYFDYSFILPKELFLPIIFLCYSSLDYYSSSEPHMILYTLFSIQVMTAQEQIL